MNQFTQLLSTALASKDAYGLARLVSTDPNPQNSPMADSMLANKRVEYSRRAMENYFKGSIQSPWDDIAISLTQVIAYQLDKNSAQAYLEQATLVNHFFRFFIGQTKWSLPALFTMLIDLRTLATQTDLEASRKMQKSDALEDAARICNKAFTNCIMDRMSSPAQSRKWGTYRALGLVLKCYFQTDRIALAKNVLRAISAQPDLPPLTKFPKADQVTCNYYLGRIHFLNEEYGEAYTKLHTAFRLCYRDAVRNQELILTYLIPLSLLQGTPPAPALLSAFPRLAEVYTPFVNALRKGDVKAYDNALEWAEVRFAESHVTMCMEKSREGCLRGLVRRVWLALSKPTRLYVASVLKAFHLSGLTSYTMEEAECILAILIYKGYMKGYISHEKQVVVLAKVEPFPKLGTKGVGMG